MSLPRLVDVDVRSSRALPVALPVAAHGRVHRVSHKHMRQSAVVGAAAVLKPCSVVRILVKVLRAYVVVLALHHAAQAGKEALNHVGVLDLPTGS